MANACHSASTSKFSLLTAFTWLMVAVGLGTVSSLGYWFFRTSFGSPVPTVAITPAAQPMSPVVLLPAGSVAEIARPNMPATSEEAETTDEQPAVPAPTAEVETPVQPSPQHEEDPEPILALTADQKIAIAEIEALGGKIEYSEEAPGSVEGVNLQGRVLTDAHLAHLEPLSGSLRQVNLHDTDITDKGLSCLLQCPHLEVVSVGGGQIQSRITDQGVRLLSRLTALKSLSLFGTAVTAQGTMKLTQLQELRFLNLGWCKRVTDDSLAHIAELNGLEILRLDSTQVTDRGLIHLTTMPNLHTLDLSMTRVSDEGISYLGSIDQLRNLNLAYSNITDNGLEKLGELKNLEWLALSGTEITGAGVAKLKNLSRLQYLNLSNTGITHASLLHLRELSSLETLDISVSGSGVVALQQALPKLKIK